ncbi:MAG: membrane protein insertion efficiency factor YidD [Pseudomonadota bacterium]
MGWLKAILIRMIRIYRYALSPLFWGCCKFDPSCSAYALEALDKHSFGVALWLMTKRLLRCHPFNQTCGFDPVPDRKD